MFGAVILKFMCNLHTFKIDFKDTSPHENKVKFIYLSNW